MSFWVIQKARSGNSQWNYYSGPVVRAGTLIAAVVRYGTLIMFFFDDVLALAFRAFDFQHHLSLERLYIYHQAAPAIAAVPLLDVLVRVHTRAKIYKNNSK
jgi:hypothetical protein